jgi:hypothetical protein
MPRETVGTNTTHAASVMQRIWMISAFLNQQPKRGSALKKKKKEDNGLLKKKEYIQIYQFSLLLLS